MNPDYITDTTKTMKVGDIYIQRTKRQMIEGPRGGRSADMERYWVVTEKHVMPDRTTLTCGDEELTLRGHATRKFFLTPRQHNTLYSRSLESKDCFNFPLNDYVNAMPWMQRFHNKLGYSPLSVGDDPILARALQKPLVSNKRKLVEVLVSTHCV